MTSIMTSIMSGIVGIRGIQYVWRRGIDMTIAIVRWERRESVLYRPGDWGRRRSRRSRENTVVEGVVGDKG